MFIYIVKLKTEEAYEHLCPLKSISSCGSTCSLQRTLPIVKILLQPVRTNVGEKGLPTRIMIFIPVPLLFNDSSLWVCSDPRLCLKVKYEEVFSIITIVVITIYFFSLIIPFTAHNLLVYVNT